MSRVYELFVARAGKLGTLKLQSGYAAEVLFVTQTGALNIAIHRDDKGIDVAEITLKETSTGAGQNRLIYQGPLDPDIMNIICNASDTEMIELESGHEKDHLRGLTLDPEVVPTDEQGGQE